jgi:hypothetical protein
MLQGGQRTEMAKYKKIENSKGLLVGTVGLTLRLNFEGWLNFNS